MDSQRKRHSNRLGMPPREDESNETHGHVLRGFVVRLRSLDGFERFAL